MRSLASSSPPNTPCESGKITKTFTQLLFLLILLFSSSVTRADNFSFRNKQHDVKSHYETKLAMNAFDDKRLSAKVYNLYQGLAFQPRTKDNRADSSSFQSTAKWDVIPSRGKTCFWKIYTAVKSTRNIILSSKSNAATEIAIIYISNVCMKLVEVSSDQTRSN